MSYSFASRIQAVEFPPIAEAMSWIKKDQGNRALLNMCQAVPSYPPAETLQEEIARLAREPGTGGYTDIFGIMPLREAFAAHMSAAYGAPITADRAAITTGCNQAFAAAIMAIAAAGDNVVMPTPWYFNHQMWLSMLGVAINPIPAFSAGANHPDVAAARAAIDDRTKAIVLCTPNNPSGAIYPPQVIAAFFDLALEKGLALFLDETYRDFRPEASPPHDLFTRPDWEKTLIQLYSFSKIYALAGYRLGSMIAGPELLHEVAKIIDCMTICAPQITQRAVLFGLTALEPWKNEKRALMAGRLAAMRQAFTTPGLNYQLVSSGAYFAYVRHPFKGESSKSVAQRLCKENDLLCLPGSMFGPGQEDYLRLAFANVDAGLMPELAARLLESQK